MKWSLTETIIGDPSDFKPTTKAKALKELREILKSEGKDPNSASEDDIIIVNQTVKF